MLILDTRFSITIDHEFVIKIENDEVYIYIYINCNKIIIKKKQKMSISKRSPIHKSGIVEIIYFDTKVCCNVKHT